MAAADKINMDGTATLIVAWRGGRHAFARGLKAGGDVIEVLTGYAATTAQMINDGQGRIYDPGDEQDEERDYLSANREELLDTALLAQIERGSSLPLIPPDELRDRRIALYALLVGNNPASRSIFIRKGSPVKLATKNLIAIFDETLTRVTAPILAFDETFDIVLTPTDVVVLNQPNFEALFKESDAVLAKTAEWADDLGKALPISD